MFFICRFSLFDRGGIYGEPKCNSMFPSSSKCHQTWARTREIGVIDVYIRGEKRACFERTEEMVRGFLDRRCCVRPRRGPNLSTILKIAAIYGRLCSLNPLHGK